MKIQASKDKGFCKFSVKKSCLQGQITIPSSKSHTLRAILFGSLGKGQSAISRYLLSSDTHAMIEACRLLGAKIEIENDCLHINGIDGEITHAEDVIQAGNSGIVLRFISAVSALASKPIVITGDHSIRHQRPMKTLSDGLRQLGASVESTRGDGFAPLIIRGPIKGGRTAINGEDSQPVSALLIASIFAQNPVTIEVKNAGEKPWVDLTLDWLKRLEISCQHQDYSFYHLPGKKRYSGFSYHVPGDWSSAAFPMVAALVTRSEVILNNLDMHDSQGDKAIVDLLIQMGARIERNDLKRQVHVKNGSSLKGADIDVNNLIDAVPILAVLGCYAEGKTRLYNAAIARHKECDRLHCIAQELTKMGANIKEHEDGLTIKHSKLKGATLHSCHDHRIAMSLAVAAMGAEDDTFIHNSECVYKTFPSFSEDFIKLGAQIQEMS